MKDKPLNKSYGKNYYGDKGAQTKARKQENLKDIERLILKAVENEIEIYEAPALIKKISDVDYFEEIPDRVFTAVSEIMNFVFKIDAAAPVKKQTKEG